MKRSEMVKAILDELEGYDPHGYGPGGLAELVLTLAEKNGMIPPTYLKECSIYSSATGATGLLAEKAFPGVKTAYRKEVNEWEPE